jgi:Rrf2 family protein
MKISKKGDYALRALLCLALHYDKGVMHMTEIAGREDIPKKFLEQILLLLKGAGFVQSKSGVGGGYMLARPPEEIALGDVIRVVDGPLAPIGCVSKKFHVACPREKTCGIRSIMQDVRNATAQILDNITLGDVCNRTKGVAKRKTRTIRINV